MTWKHGWSGYHNHGCRCRTCTDGWAAYRRGYVRRRLARGWRISQGKFYPRLPTPEDAP